MTILDDIIAYKRAFVKTARKCFPIDKVRSAALSAPLPRSFINAISAPAGSIRIIAEVKKASPSRGILRRAFDPACIANRYANQCAAAISVLTDEKYFQGSLNDLHAVRGASEIPILRKEFIIDEYQIYEARAAGADAVLLIPAIISDAEFVKFHNLIQQLGMTALVEVHTGQELRRAFRAFPRVIGINNRNLKDFSLDIQQTALLRKHIPPEICVVSESGIKTRADIAFLKNNNIQAALIGETFMKAPDPGVALMELIK